MTLQAWTKTNIWGELERWYRLPKRLSVDTLRALGGDPQVLAGPWSAVCRAELSIYGQEIWLSGHNGGLLLCASTRSNTPLVFAEVDARMTRLFGPLDELVDVGEEQLGPHLVQGA